MTLEYVRSTYHVPAKRGGRVLYRLNSGRIVSATHNLYVLMDNGGRYPIVVHPTDPDLVYLDAVQDPPR